ncbi:hypothetical protein TNCV_3534041 [Trichonephila clavipes]|nr:hypothetical protein TNCV_3534041 [Trichonephila clavipes]
MCSREHGEVVLKYDACRRQIYRPIIKRNRRTTAQQVSNQFLAASGAGSPEKLLPETFEGEEDSIRTQTCCVCPIARQHRTARLQWCREHLVD